MEAIDDIEIKEFHSILITLACQTSTLCCLFQRVPFTPSNLQETLVSVGARLKKISSFLLIERAILKPGSETWPSLYVNRATSPSSYKLASTALANVFPHFTPLYALCFALNDYNGSGGSNRKRNPCYWVAGKGKAVQISSTDESISKIFFGVVAACESQILCILSGFHVFRERISAFYPFYSPHSRSIQSRLLEEWQVQDSPQYFIQTLEEVSPFSDGGSEFSTDPNQVVSAEYWDWRVEDPSCQLRVPEIATLHLREVSKASSGGFAVGFLASQNLQDITHVLVHLALFRRGKSRFTDIFTESGTSKDNAAVGMLLLRDEARVSIGPRRIKEKSIFLFEKCLVFAREKSPGQLIVCRVAVSQLLQVRYKSESPSKGSGILTIYWRQIKSLPGMGQEVNSAQIFFNDLGVLKIWAAFLAVHASTESAAGNLHFGTTEPWAEDMKSLPRITRIQEVLSLVPAIYIVEC